MITPFFDTEYNANVVNEGTRFAPGGNFKLALTAPNVAFWNGVADLQQ